MKLKHSIGQLALAIPACAVATRAICSPSLLWAATIFTLATALFAFATVGASCGRGRGRAACAGMALCGWAYLAAIYGPWTGENLGRHLTTNAWIDLLHSAIGRTEPPEDFNRVKVTRPLMKIARDQLQAEYVQVKRIAQTDPSLADEAAMQRAREKIASMNDWLLLAESASESKPGPRLSECWAMWTNPNPNPPRAVGPVMSPEPFRRICHGLFAIAFALAGGAFGRFMADRGAAGEAQPAEPTAA